MSAAQTKTFDARVIGTLTTGIVLVDGSMSSVHEAFEHVLGHPVWTHEMANADVLASAKRAIVAIYPDFPVDKPSDWQALSDDLVRRFPDGVTLPRGTSQRSADPLTTLREMIGEETDVAVVRLS